VDENIYSKEYNEKERGGPNAGKGPENSGKV
jgi:hypothetical protein